MGQARHGRRLRFAMLGGAVGLLVFTIAGSGRQTRSDPPAVARAWEDTLTLPTYEEGLPDPNPPFDLFVDRRFSYPYTLRTNLTDRRSPLVWRALNLENEYLKCVVLPTWVATSMAAPTR